MEEKVVMLGDGGRRPGLCATRRCVVEGRGGSLGYCRRVTVVMQGGAMRACTSDAGGQKGNVTVGEVK
jgi:hypothetical protein